MATYQIVSAPAIAPAESRIVATAAWLNRGSALPGAGVAMVDIAVLGACRGFSLSQSARIRLTARRPSRGAGRRRPVVYAAHSPPVERHGRTLVRPGGRGDTRTVVPRADGLPHLPQTLPAQDAAFDCVDAKLRIPAPRPGSVTRTALVNRLRAAHTVPVVAVVAPAGYGKTTVLAQWADRDERPFGWVTLDERDNDPIVLLRHVAAALDGCAPLTPSTLQALRSPGDSVWTTAVPRVASALASVESPHVLVLDRSSRLRSKESAEVVSVLAEHIGEGSTLVLSGRVQPPLPVAALRARGLLFEVGPELLALNRREAEALLEASGVELSDEQVATLLRCTEGWAAGLYLAALAVRDGGADGDATGFVDDDRYLADFFRSECLSTLEPERLAFLRRTSVLERISGPLCDAVLERNDSARELRALDEANLFVVGLDRSGTLFRYHGLFRNVLRHELECNEPELVPMLHRRAADWHETQGNWDAAINHAAEGRDIDRAASIVGSRALAECDAGRTEATERWLELFDVQVLERHSELAFVGAWVHALRGRTAEAERWRAVAESGAEPDGPINPWNALLDAALCRDGAEQMRADAETAVSRLAPIDPRRPVALLFLGAAQALIGDDERADHTLDQVAAESAIHRAPGSSGAALALRSLIASARGDDEEADLLAFQARALYGDEPTWETALDALVGAAFARALLRRGRWEDAQRGIAAAESLAPMLTDALPWLSAQVYLELAKARVALRDTDQARTLVAKAEAILRRRPGLGVVGDTVDRLRGEVAEDQRAGGPEDEADGRRAPAPSAARDASLLPRDRCPALHLSQYRQDGGALDLPQARGIEPKRGCRPGHGARTPRRRDTHPATRHILRSPDQRKERACRHHRRTMTVHRVGLSSPRS